MSQLVAHEIVHVNKKKKKKLEQFYSIAIVTRWRRKTECALVIVFFVYDTQPAAAAVAVR